MAPFSTAAATRMMNAQVAHMAPFSLTIGGKKYDGTRSTVSLDRLFLPEGKLETYEFSWTCSQWQFRETTLPAIGSVVTDTKTPAISYRVLAHQKDGADIGIRLDLGAKDETSA